MIYGFRRMIYLLRKHDIISVPSYAAGIYHRTKCDIIPKIYHPFRQERISLKNDKFLSKLVVFHGGAGGIRTLGTLLTYTRFPVVPVMTSSILLHNKFNIYFAVNSLVIIVDSFSIVKPFLFFFSKKLALPLPKAPIIL